MATAVLAGFTGGCREDAVDSGAKGAPAAGRGVGHHVFLFRLGPAAPLLNMHVHEFWAL